MEGSVEVRLITYRRPRLLERALRSLLAQTHADWRAVVYDDSSAFESREVVARLGDPRIETRQNPRNLGMVGNLSLAFAPGSVFPTTTHACILEDDNAFDPDWLEQNLRVMSTRACRVMCRNYRVVEVLPDGALRKTANEPMRDIYGREARYLDYQERVKEAFFSFTIGTCCFFWNTHSGVDLSAGCERINGPVMEPIRATCFRDPCWYEPEPLSCFSQFVDKTQTPRSETPVSTQRRRVGKVSEILFTRHLYQTWTNEFHLPVIDILNAASSRSDGKEALQRLADAGCLQAVRRLPDSRSRLAAVKSWAVLLLYRRKWAQINRPVPVPDRAGV